MDVLSIILSTFGFGGLLYGFSIAGSAGWLNPTVLLPLLIGSVSLYFFIKRQFKLKQPILEFRVFKDKIFTLATILGMIVFMSMIGSTVILPMLMQNMLGYNAFESGLMLLPGALVMGIMNPVAGRMFDMFGARYLLITGLGIVTVTTFMFTMLDSGTTFAYLAIVNAVRMFGVSMVMMPATTAGLNQLSNRLVPHGTAMNNTMRQIAGALGTAMLISVMAHTMNPETGVDGMVQGVNHSFMVASIISLVGFILAFWIHKPKKLPEE